MEANPIVEDMLNKNPLILFSLYTSIHSRIVREQGQEIVRCFDGGPGPAINRGYGQFWLWVLGAYEVLRTMCQAEGNAAKLGGGCFSPRVATELRRLNHRLRVIRVPFAKQELPGKKNVPVSSEPSICEFGDSQSDLKFEVYGELVSARELIAEFERVFGGITRAEVLADHRTIYSPNAA